MRRGLDWTGLAEFWWGEGKNRGGDEGRVWHGNLEMRKKLEKESWGLTGVAIKGKDFLRVCDYANNVDESQDLAKVGGEDIMKVLNESNYLMQSCFLLCYLSSKSNNGTVR